MKDRVLLYEASKNKLTYNVGDNMQFLFSFSVLSVLNSKWKPKKPAAALFLFHLKAKCALKYIVAAIGI